jgi:hypothetical protein
MSTYSLNRMLLAISMCKFYKGCSMQFGASAGTSGRSTGSCITIALRATHRLLCSNLSPGETVLCNRLTLRSRFERDLAVPYSETGPQGDTFLRPNSGRFQKRPSGGSSNNYTIDEARVCVRKGPTLRVIMKAFQYVLPLECNTTIPGTFWLSIIFHFSNKNI